MQASPSLTWVEYALAGLATIIAGAAGSFFTWLSLRKKIAPEIDGIQAAAEKTRAEARQLDGNTIALAYDRIDELWCIVEDQRVTIASLSRDNDKKGIAEDLFEDEIRWLHAVLTASGVKLSDYDHLRRKHHDPAE